MFYIDPLYLIMIAPALILAVYAQIKVRSAFSKWSRVANTSGLSGAAAARRILDSAGLFDVAVEVSQGWLSDHYNPRTRVLALSPNVYSVNSVAAVGIAAHEAGHAIQHASQYAPLRFRNAIVPMARIGSWPAFLMIIGGFILMGLKMIVVGKLLAWAGLFIFAGLVLFQIVTLPVEFNASRRAKKVVADLGIIQAHEEALGVNSVLNAAALTYVAATVTALVELLYWVVRLGVLSDD